MVKNPIRNSQEAGYPDNHAMMDWQQRRRLLSAGPTSLFFVFVILRLYRSLKA
jgi:hypothetical protein